MKTDADRLSAAGASPAAGAAGAQEAPARRVKSNVRTALVLACVAAAFYFGMIFLGPLSR